MQPIALLLLAATWQPAIDDATVGAATPSTPERRGAPATPLRSIDIIKSQLHQHDDVCFVLTNDKQTVRLTHNPTRAALRFSPCSTFKLPNSLIGLDTGVIRDADFVLKWDGTRHSRAVCNRDHSLRSALQHSVVWYYQELARRVGLERMTDAIHRLDYGNLDLSAGIDQFWLGTSLAISANEQVAFLRRLNRRELPFSERAIDIVKNCMVLSSTDGVTLRGKTGSHRGVGQKDLGWFVGWVDGPNGTWYFAMNISGERTWGVKARKLTIDILRELALLPAAK